MGQRIGMRHQPFRCPNCRRKIKPRPEGHINAHWVDDAYTCQTRKARK